MLFKGTDRYQKGEIDLITLRNGGREQRLHLAGFHGLLFHLRLGPLAGGA